MFLDMVVFNDLETLKKLFPQIVHVHITAVRLFLKFILRYVIYLYLYAYKFQASALITS
jgi:hypothetical protein